MITALLAEPDLCRIDSVQIIVKPWIFILQVKSDFETLRQRHQEEGVIEDVSKEVAKLRESVYRTNEEVSSNLEVFIFGIFFI